MSKRNIEIPVHCKGIAVVLLKKFGEEYKVLLLKRATSILKDAWCYIGGSIEEGESAWQSAFREIEEETGITEVLLYTSNKLDQFYSPYENYIYMAPVFVGYVNDDQKVNLNYEHSEYKWLSFNEALEQVTLPGNDEVLTFIEKHFVKNTPSKLLRVRNYK
ncbi:NUDIX domain-containing protein [Rummeliibacillus stabekisii]|uniref:NUDIX domain-containing protein n=1 Tax=Rummeliibacillus stabekisii TaxID=241244 RepID=UPI00116BB78B|nr:NUDIX domain-containing protein [Rummeliibacillus stabekisii]MBB5170726.1 dATP pyrophosphohydrolase [Rummeliibacillus stabekisii]GEL06220.1 DNA mismatch repair protein MutT [Rummeliibacillus stabekisii]